MSLMVFAVTFLVTLFSSVAFAEGIYGQVTEVRQDSVTVGVRPSNRLEEGDRVEIFIRTIDGEIRFGNGRVREIAKGRVTVILEEGQGNVTVGMHAEITKSGSKTKWRRHFAEPSVPGTQAPERAPGNPRPGM